jgi:predicted nucleotidyltransferase
MNRDRAIALLNDHASEIKARGVARLGLIGSTARGEAGPDSDVDVLAEIEPGRVFTLFDLVALSDFLSEILDQRVDVVLARGQMTPMQRNVQAERVEVF